MRRWLRRARLPPVRGRDVQSQQPFLEAEVRRWGRYSGAPSDEQLSRFFLLGPGDLERVHRARTEVTRLGYAVQLCTVRFLGAFPAEVSQTPRVVVGHVARQVGANPAGWDDYVGSRTRLVHQEATRAAFGFSVFGTGAAHVAFLRWLWGRCWTAEDPPPQLQIDHSVSIRRTARLNTTGRYKCCME